MSKINYRSVILHTESDQFLLRYNTVPQQKGGQKTRPSRQSQKQKLQNQPKGALDTFIVFLSLLVLVVRHQTPASFENEVPLVILFLLCIEGVCCVGHWMGPIVSIGIFYPDIRLNNACMKNPFGHLLLLFLLADNRWHQRFPVRSVLPPLHRQIIETPLLEQQWLFSWHLPQMYEKKL